MEKNRSSMTAYRVAMSRAVHQILDNPKVLDDPIALRIVGPQGAHDIHSSRQRFETKPSRYLRAFVVARSRFAEDALSEAIKRGVRQYVILGAGLDTFAYRNPYPVAMLRVFEIDYPATQVWKREQLGAAEISIPESLTFVPIDFETQSLAVRLQEVGFRTDEPSFFSWLGVTMYLTREAVMTTLKYVVSATPRGSEIVLDYVTPASSSNPLADRAAAIGEPWKTFFDPLTFSAELEAIGYGNVCDVGTDEINARLFGGRSDELRVGGHGRLISARV